MSSPFIREIEVKSVITKSNLPVCEYSVNPYVGCTHGCRYCYASFMKRFTGYAEPWGTFLDVKIWPEIKNPKKYAGKELFISSVTDPYLPQEERYGRTRALLEQLKESGAKISIATKSDLILRDLDLIQAFPEARVSWSVNTLNESFKNDMDNADSIQKRIDTLKQLHDNGIYTVLFMSPIFPAITDFKAIIEKTQDFVDEYWFENLNLRGEYKHTILSYIFEKYPKLTGLYKDIYIYGKEDYWVTLSQDIEQYCERKKLKYKNYFYHNELVKNKLSVRTDIIRPNQQQ